MTAARMVCGIGLVLLAGCVTGGQNIRLNIGNNSHHDLREVELYFGNELVYRTDRLISHSSQDIPRGRSDVPVDAMLRWVDPEGTQRAHKLHANAPLPDAFSGRVFYQINATNDVRVFAEADRTDDESVIPWNRPETWEGSPMIPGFSPE